MSGDRNSPATKGNLRNLEDKLIEAIRDSQTEVLKVFYGFTQTIQASSRKPMLPRRRLKRRMSTLESRILEIEKRLNLPPSAA